VLQAQQTNVKLQPFLEEMVSGMMVNLPCMPQGEKTIGCLRRCDRNDEFMDVRW
jgi:hypothetical protein